MSIRSIYEASYSGKTGESLSGMALVSRIE
jgi:hypothetical protein